MAAAGLGEVRYTFSPQPRRNIEHGMETKNMKAYIANLLWDALWIFLHRVHDWFFDPKRAAEQRFRDRERWWAYKCKAEATASKKDDMRAEWFRLRFDFNTEPTRAQARGDLNPHPRVIAMKAVEETRAKFSGPHQP